jgi:hypothetical protein
MGADNVAELTKPTMCVIMRHGYSDVGAEKKICIPSGTKVGNHG